MMILWDNKCSYSSRHLVPYHVVFLKGSNKCCRQCLCFPGDEARGHVPTQVLMYSIIKAATSLGKGQVKLDELVDKVKQLN